MKATEKQKERYKAYYQKNKQRWAKYRKPLKTPEEKLAAKLVRQEWKASHPEIYLWSTVKYRCTKENIPFDIEPVDLVIPEFCPYLGIKLTTEKGSGHLDNLASVDRIIPKLGYIKGNVEVISYKANRMKNDATINELVVFAKNVLERYKNV